MTKEKLLELLNDIPDGSEVAVRSCNGSIETIFELTEVNGGTPWVRHIDYILEPNYEY